MDLERRARLKEIYFAALDLEAGQLHQFVAEACGDDAAMREEIISLVTADRANADTFLERPAVRELSLLTVDGTDSVEDSGVRLPVEDWERYTDLELIASGGMGDVFRAFDPRLKRHAALKFIRGPSMKHVDRFLREAEAQARVEHENVLEVYETGEVEGQLYIAMRYISGPTLKETRDETTVEQKVVIMRQVAEAIHAAHREGLVHRDIKPSNILIERTADGVLKPWVMDFGIVADDRSPALTTTGDLVGTPWFMAPERLGGDECLVDRRSDIYSLGVTLFEYLSGERPYPAQNPIELFAQVKETEPRRLRRVAPDLPQDLETIVMKCLEREPDRRYPSARDLAVDLGRYLDGEPVDARRANIAYRLMSWVKRNRAVATVSAVAVVLLAVLAGFNVQSRMEARVREERARIETLQREDIARDFTHKVEEIENIIRMARVAPVHDLSAENKVVGGMIDVIVEQVKATGDLGVGSGNFALGRAHLALGQYLQAWEKLQRAEKRGFEGAAVSAAIGQTLAGLYLEATNEAERIDDPVQREQALAKAGELRDEAQGHLEKAAPVDSSNPELFLAWKAFLNGNSDEALVELQRSLQKFPWLFEARKLEGDIFNQLGATAWRHGEVDVARTNWDQASSAYDQATIVARSYREAYVGACRVGQSLIALAVDHDRDAMDGYFDAALAACDNARTVDPTRLDVVRWISNLYYQRALAALRFGGDPRDNIEQAIRVATQALTLNENDAGALLARANAFVVEAWAERSLGVDPRDSLQQAITTFDKVLRSNSRSSAALRNKGAALVDLARSESVRGGDPRPSLAAAIKSLTAAVEVATDDLHVVSDLAGAYLALAEVSLGRGEVAMAHLDRARDYYHFTVESNPRFAAGLVGLGRCHLVLARSEVAQGIDPASSLSQAAIAFKTALEHEPELAIAWVGQAEHSAVAAVVAPGKERRTIARAGLEATATALEMEPNLEAAVRVRDELQRLVRGG